MKTLIIPGFPKSGTTFLYSQLIRQTDQFNIPMKKELGFFESQNDLAGFKSMFQTNDPEKTYIDFSPNYYLNSQQVIKNIKECIGDGDVKILFCMREPTSRAYSHYMHDLSNHFFLYGHHPYSFFAPTVLNRYFFQMKKPINNFMKAFGASNLEFFSFEDSPEEIEHLSKFLGLDEHSKLDFSDNPARGGCLPRIYFDDNRHLVVASEDRLYELPPKTFFLKNTRYQQLRQNFPSNVATILMQNANSWDREFEISRLGTALELLIDDFQSCYALLKKTSRTLDIRDVIFAGEPRKIERDIADKLVDLGGVSESLERTFGWQKKVKRPIIERDSAVLAIESISQNRKKTQGAFFIDNERIIRNFGPSPDLVIPYLHKAIELGEFEKVINIFDEFANLNRYIPMGPVLKKLEDSQERFSKYELVCLREVFSS